MSSADTTYCDGKNCSEEYKICCKRFDEFNDVTNRWMMNSTECLLSDNRLFISKVPDVRSVNEAYNELNKRMYHC